MNMTATDISGLIVEEDGITVIVTKANFVNMSDNEMIRKAIELLKEC